jgi:membrane-associated phospholipid phosphatase
MTPKTSDTPAIADTPASRWLLLAGALALCALAALTIDCPVATWCRVTALPSDLKKPLTIVEGFGHGAGVLMLLLAIYVLDPARRWAIPRVAATAFGAGLVANVVKVLVGRTRPRAFDFHGGAWDTFTGLFPSDALASANQSFPSAHTATIVGLAFALTWLYPRGKWLFAAMAVLVACQRIQSEAHYLSDTLFAAALGCLVAIACLKAGPVRRWFDRKEHQWQTKRGSPGSLTPS